MAETLGIVPGCEQELPSRLVTDAVDGQEVGSDVVEVPFCCENDDRRIGLLRARADLIARLAPVDRA